MATIGIEHEVELISTNVTDPTSDNYVCGTSENGFYRGKIGSEVGATDPNYIYEITNIEKDFPERIPVSKYKYRLYVGDIIYLDGKWLRVIKGIDLSYGAEQDNGEYDITIQGACPAVSWISREVVESMVDGVVEKVEKEVNYYKFCRIYIEGEKVHISEVVQNDASGEYVDLTSKIISTYNTKFEVTDELPPVGFTFTILPADNEEDTSLRDITVITPPSLPVATDANYYEELKEDPICEADKLYTVLELQPFDKLSTSFATADYTMTYVVKTTNKFNSFTLAGVTATELTYKVKNSRGVVVEEDSVEIDCYLDDAHLLGQTTTTLFLQFDELYDAGYTIEIELRNNGEVKLGSFFTNLFIDEGMTQFNIQPSIRDYNNYTPDTWGQIPEAVKSKVKQCKVEVVLPFETFDRSYQRHKFLQGKFATIDVTDSKAKNKYTLTSLVMRGILLEVSPAIIVKSNGIDDYYKYSLVFLEVV